MYEAKNAALEVPRLAILFERERTGTLSKTSQRCSHSGEQVIEDNFLSCCLGVKCKECSHLKALDAAKLTSDQIDWIKAWTCTGHILSKGGEMAGEGFITTVDERMFWDGVYESLSS